ncbi:ANTAR domain-containing protein [Streptomyces sp. NPDC052225]|uniref:ANTAR domain-containing protein n=1 Tax=Streptomyces sp. NPDC052225 TaxID=3154949 RepID=UPI0034230EE3
MPESAWSAEGAVSATGVAPSANGARRLSGLTLFLRPDGERTLVSVRGDLDLESEVDERVRDTLRAAVMSAESGVELALDDIRSNGHASVDILLSVAPSSLAPPTDGDLLPGDEDSEDVDALRLEVAQLRQAMRSRGMIDLARGILVAALGLDPEDAWETLVTISQHTNIKLHTVARALMDSTVGGQPLPDDIKNELAAAVARCAARDGGSSGTVGAPSAGETLDVAASGLRTE